MHEAPCAVEDGRLTLRVLLDRSSIEVFAAGGTAVLTDLIFPSSGGHRLELFTDPSRPVPNLPHARVSGLRSAWR